jgi:Elongation factor 1 gamma, conserved domain
VVEEVKKKDPLNDLPKSKMVMDSWKRLYSNTPAALFKSVCCAGLWNGADIPNSPTGEHFEGFDSEGYSLWFIEHKYPEEQKVQYRALNAVSGFFQRCDYARKHAFAIVSILEDKAAGTFPIQGFWIFRGQEVNWQMIEECVPSAGHRLCTLSDNPLSLASPGAPTSTCTSSPRPTRTTRLSAPAWRPSSARMRSSAACRTWRRRCSSRQQAQ